MPAYKLNSHGWLEKISGCTQQFPTSCIILLRWHQNWDCCRYWAYSLEQGRLSELNKTQFGNDMFVLKGMAMKMGVWQLGKFCKVVNLTHGGSLTNGAAMSSLVRILWWFPYWRWPLTWLEGEDTGGGGAQGTLLKGRHSAQASWHQIWLSSDWSCSMVLIVTLGRQFNLYSIYNLFQSCLGDCLTWCLGYCQTRW